MTPTVDHLTPDEQAEHYGRLISDTLPVLQRHGLGKLALRMTDLTALAERFRTGRVNTLLHFAARIRAHGNILSGVRIGWHFHRWADPLGSRRDDRDNPDARAMRALADDLQRVLRGDAPRH